VYRIDPLVRYVLVRQEAPRPLAAFGPDNIPKMGIPENKFGKSGMFFEPEK
jgi:hypothetical protein